MSRQETGWEYIAGRPRWAPTISMAIGELTCDKDGQEYEDLHADLMDIVRAAQRECEEKLRDWAKGLSAAGTTGTSIAAIIDEGADLIAPRYPEDSDN